MAPIKFDEHIREQLQEREIQPSNDAWDNLQKQLNHAPKKNDAVKWYAIAASVIGFVIVASVLFNKSSQATFNPDIVEINSSQEQIIPSQIENNSDKNSYKAEKVILNQESQITQEDNSSNVKNAIKVIRVDKPKIANKKGNDIAFQPEEFSAENKNLNTNKEEMLTPSEIKITSEKINSVADFENAKIAEVVAQLTELQNANHTVSADEIEALLTKAQKEIATNKLLSNNNKKVDAMALLNLVEEELETSFRDKVFERLGTSFQKVRTAVVNRDN